MLTIGPVSFWAFVAHIIVFGLIWRSLAFALSRRNENGAFARAMHFIY